MIVNADMTIFNQVVGADRREVFIPTVISGVCWYDVRSMGTSGRMGDPSRNRAAKFIVRIPISANIQGGRKYIPEARYKLLPKESLAEFWTIQLDSYIVKDQYVPADGWLWDPFDFRSSVITEVDVTDIDSLRAANEDFGTVVEYADNTVRGSNMVKHWRIGGA